MSTYTQIICLTCSLMLFRVATHLEIREFREKSGKHFDKKVKEKSGKFMIKKSKSGKMKLICKCLRKY